MFSSKTLTTAGGFLLLLLSSPLTHAVQDNVWIGGASTDWNNPANCGFTRD